MLKRRPPKGPGRHAARDRLPGAGSRGKGRRRPVFEIETPDGDVHTFPSDAALLRWAAGEARRLFPAAAEPVVRRARPRSLYALPSREALEEWLIRPKSARFLDHREAVLLGRVRVRRVAGEG